ncbi:MAG: hypothetical protein ACK5H4_20650 [Lacrimispora sphenoides]
MQIIPILGRERITAIIGHTMKEYSKILRQDGIRLDNKPGGLSEGIIAVISTMLSYAVFEGMLSINHLICSGKRRGRQKAAKEYEDDYLAVGKQFFIPLLSHYIRQNRLKKHQMTAN